MQVEDVIKGIASLIGKKAEDMEEHVFEKQEDGTKALKPDALEILLGHANGHFERTKEQIKKDRYGMGFKDAADQLDAENAKILGIELKKGEKLTEKLPGYLEKSKQPTLTWETIKADPVLMDEIKEQTRQSVAEFETK